MSREKSKEELISSEDEDSIMKREVDDERGTEGIPERKRIRRDSSTENRTKVSNVTTPDGKFMYYTGTTRSGKYDVDGDAEEKEGGHGRIGTERRTVGIGHRID